MAGMPCLLLTMEAFLPPVHLEWPVWTRSVDIVNERSEIWFSNDDRVDPMRPSNWDDDKQLKTVVSDIKPRFSFSFAE
jgi:hypothetical protein